MGVKFLFQREQKKLPEQLLVYRFFKKILPLAQKKGVGSFFVKEGGKWKFTLLFLALLVVESSDIVFALDSIPAVFAVTTDPFIAYTSNIFAVLGLRSLYFCLRSFLEKLCYLNYGLGAILLFVGTKMVIADIYSIPLLVSLGVILLTLGATTFFSLRKRGNFP